MVDIHDARVIVYMPTRNYRHTTKRDAMTKARDASNLLTRARSAAGGTEQVAAESAAEQSRIGAAATRKQREEADQSIDATLASAEHHGRAVYWRRRHDGRTQLVAERSGAYSERAFLRLTRIAAEQAGRGRWRAPAAVETVAAELVVRILARTQGRMPAVGSLGRPVDDHQDPDLAYLTAAASRIIASAARGDADAAGLASEAAPTAVSADADSVGTLTLAELASEALADSEGTRDPYIEDGSGDVLNERARAAAENLADQDGHRPRAVLAAIVAAMRPELHSADLADAGYAASPGSARVAAHRGRPILRQLLARVALLPEQTWTDADRRAAEALATLACEEASPPTHRHPMEEGSVRHRARRVEWPADVDPVWPPSARTKIC